MPEMGLHGEMRLRLVMGGSMKWITTSLLLLSSLNASATIYKCTEPDGRISYRQTPCQENGEALNPQDVPASV
ncbi:MAG: DUF4124 domain-containing protein, partial [Candidatus Competibacteraceae bacterium]|nr:DUF4124 domain-containing protein [Candidatus Competibacteraceae bacterium]